VFATWLVGGWIVWNSERRMKVYVYSRTMAVGDHALLAGRYWNVGEGGREHTEMVLCCSFSFVLFSFPSWAWSVYYFLYLV